jgi:fatty acid desaturase
MGTTMYLRTPDVAPDTQEISMIASTQAARAPAASGAGIGGVKRKTPLGQQEAYPRGYTTPAELKGFIKSCHRTSLPRSVAAAVWDHAAILAALGAASFAYGHLPFPVALLVNIVALVVAARFQRALECLVHEASHYNWHRNGRRANDALATLLAALPVWGRLADYRASHALHHRRMGTPDDPDLQRYQSLDLEDLDRSTLRSYSSGVVRRLGPYMTGWWATVGLDLKLAASALAWQAAALVAPSWALFGPRGALFVWGNWTASFFLVLPAIRFVSEAGEHRYLGTRTVFDATMANVGWVHRLVFHPHNDGLHILHHLWPGVPHHQARRLHEALRQVDPLGYQARLKWRSRVLQDPVTTVAPR